MKNKDNTIKMITAYCVTGLLLNLFIVALLQAAATKRLAAVYYSDGTVLTGKISLTSNRKLRLNIPKGGSVSTTNFVTGEKVEYGKLRQFTFEPVREIRFFPEREEMQRKWKFVGKTKFDEKTSVADYSPAPKEYSGKPYPVRCLETGVTFASGETIRGHLYSAIAYLETENKTHKLFFRSKSRGKEGQGLDDLVYITHIKMLDETKTFPAAVTVKFSDMHFKKEDAMSAVTKQSLTPVPSKPGDDDNTFKVTSTFGEDVYLAIRKDGIYHVGWPEKSDPELMALAKDHIDRQRDFYNDKQLLGVLPVNDGRDLLTLVNLRRRHAVTNFSKIGGEWDKEVGGIVEPWRLSIWKWKHDHQNNELTLSARGTFFRIIFLPEDPTPTVKISPTLWNVTKKDDTIIVGNEIKGANDGSR